MAPIFADTFFWIALTNAQDQDHRRATEYARSSVSSTIWTTEEVLTEYLNSMAAIRREGIVDALTNDAHFEQEGFRAVFRSERD